MTYREYLHVLRERWVVIALVVLISLVATLSAWFLQPRQYTATLTMYLAAQATAAGTELQGVQLAQQQAASYVPLITSARVLGQVVDDLRLAESASALGSRTTATNAPGSVFIDLAVVDDSPQRAADVANAVAQVFTSVVDEIEAPTGPGAVQAVAVHVVQPAVVPTESSSTALPVSLALGLLAGLVLGVSGALARHHLDTRIRSLQQLRATVDAPVLGITTFSSAAGRRPLPIQEDTDSPHAEAYRQLRTNLLFLHGGRRHRVIAVISATSGEGKTTTLANLALALAGAGRLVAVVEADLRRPLLADLLGIDRSVGLTDVLGGRTLLNEAMQRWSDLVHVLPSGPLPPNPSELLASPQMTDLLNELRARFDIVLVDTSPLLTLTDAVGVAPATDGVLVVCRYGTTNQEQLRSAVQAIGAVSAPLVGTVLTMVPTAGPFTDIVAPATRTVPAANDLRHSASVGPAHSSSGSEAPPVAQLPPTAPPPVVMGRRPAANQVPPQFPTPPRAPVPPPSRPPRHPIAPEAGPEERNGVARHGRH